MNYLLLLCFLVFSPIIAFADSTKTVVATPAVEKRFSIDVKSMAIADVIRMISKGYNLNIVLDRQVSGTVTLNLNDVPVSAGLKALVESYGWALEQRGDVYFIGPAKESGNMQLYVHQGKVTADLVNMDITEFISDFTARSGISVVPANKLAGRVTAKLYNVPVKDALITVLEGNGFSVDFNRNIYTVSAGGSRPADMNSGSRNNSGRRRFNIDYTDDKLSLDVQNGDLGSLIQEIADLSSTELVIYGRLDGEVNARLSGIALDEGLALILAGTRYTFVRKGNTMLIGDRFAGNQTGQTLGTSKLVHLMHIKADEVPKIFPRNIAAQAITVVKEQNALLLSGTSEEIVQIEEFLRTVDIPTPQVALDVLIVEYTREIGRDLGFKFSGNHAKAPANGNYFSFPEGEFNRSGEMAKELLESVFGSKTFITNLPDDFMMTLRLLEEQKRAKVLAQPTVTVLNGNKAMIDVGSVSYFKVVGGTTDNPTSNFRPINSGIIVNITPWISQSGQITAEVSPEISNTTTINSDGYPDISRRAITTTVRIDDGKTVVLGGLLKSEEQTSHKQIPILGDIPLIGNLFKTTAKRQVQTNLVIYITPRILGNEDNVNLPTELKKLNKENSKVWMQDMERSLVKGYEADTTALSNPLRESRSSRQAREKRVRVKRVREPKVEEPVIKFSEPTAEPTAEPSAEPTIEPSVTLPVENEEMVVQ